MQIARRTLLDNGSWRIGYVSVRRASPALGDIEHQSEHVLVLPMAGVFAKHDGPRHRIVGTPGHAVVIEAQLPYRLSYPGGIGEQCLTIKVSCDALSALQETIGARRRAPLTSVAACRLLPAHLMLARNVLWHRFQNGEWDPIEAEELSGTLLDLMLRLLGDDGEPSFRPRGQRASIEAVKEAIAADPAHRWSLGGLAAVANLSPFHLSRLFRQEVGTSVYDYVLRARLVEALHALLDTKEDLTAIGLDAGFSSHSHFTERFRSFFGMTPTAFRRVAKTGTAAELRRILTAARDRSC
jgi:AraC family transcriptional regulator